MTVMVGMGIASRERRLIGLDAVLQKQALAVEGGGMGVFLTPKNLWKAVTDWTDAHGLESSLYWQNPDEAQPQPEAPDYQMLQIEVQKGMVQVEQQKAQASMQKAQADLQVKAAEQKIKEAELMLSARESEAKAKMAELQVSMGMMETQMETATTESKAALEAEVTMRDQERKDAELAVKAASDARNREVDIYKAMVQSGTTLTQEAMGLAGLPDAGPISLFSMMAPQLADMVSKQVETISNQSAQALQQISDGFERMGAQNNAAIGELQASVIDMRVADDEPQTWERDESGLVISVGGRPVVRDANGRIERLG
jgi:riboflavin synthase